jgi:hypothetical protein
LFFWLALAASGVAVVAAEVPELAPAPQLFQQETSSRWPAPSTNPTSAGFTLADLAPDGTVRVSDGAGWYLLRNGHLAAWPSPSNGPIDQGWILEGAGDVRRVPVPLSAVRQILRTNGGTWLATDQGVVRLEESAFGRELPGIEVRQLASLGAGRFLAATRQGLWQRDPQGQWNRVGILDRFGRAWGEVDVRGVAVDHAGDWWVATPAGVAHRENRVWRFYTGRDGVPVADFTQVCVAPDGRIWFGTHHGLVGLHAGTWVYREGPGWLPGNEVRSVVADAQGRVWLATSGGLGLLERKPMTLAAKAALYEDEVARLIKRTPFGYTSEVQLSVPGDRSSPVSRGDSDNDGLWTAMYGAGECFAFGALRLPEYRERAQQAFEALRFLQKVTQGGQPSPPKGFIARTIRSTADPDPNVGRLEADREARAHGDRLWKVYGPRWPKSADGRWFWKGDTSSDELDGHFFFYPLYFDLVAEDAAEKDRVREVVRDLADHFLEHDFQLVDHDGQPTRWGVFSPRHLNGDPDWQIERGINSLSMLSYMTVAEHVTGDPKYSQAIRELIDRHGYAANVMRPKLQTGLGSGNQSDDEMAFMCFYNLLKYTRERRWSESWLGAFYLYWVLEQPEMNPFFNFTYAAVAKGRSSSTPHGIFSVDPWTGWLGDSMATLHGFPLDRVNWSHRNSHRIDLSFLPPQQAVDLADPSASPRGFRVNGKVLPVEERHFNHWNTDPWQLDYGGDGRELASGTVFLLPYYMGLYYGFIARP